MAQSGSAVGTRYRVITCSRRYARPNSSIDDGLDDRMDPHVEDLVSLLGALNIERAHLSTSCRGLELLDRLGILLVAAPSRWHEIRLTRTALQVLLASPKSRCQGLS